MSGARTLTNNASKKFKKVKTIIDTYDDVGYLAPDSLKINYLIQQEPPSEPPKEKEDTQKESTQEANR